MSSLRWVVNASPLILLGEIEHLYLIESLCESLVIPAAVADEISAGLKEDAAQRWLTTDGQGYICHDEPIDSSVAGWDLGAGENAVLTWAHSHPGYEAILDDRAARKCAKTLDVPVRGTIGVLLLAKREGLIAEVRPAFESLVRAGIHMTPDLLEAALHLADET